MTGTSHSGGPVRDWLADGHRVVLSGLGQLADLDAGLREITALHGGHAGVLAALDDSLDSRAGLAGILAVTADADPGPPVILVTDQNAEAAVGQAGYPPGAPATAALENRVRAHAFARDIARDRDLADDLADDLDRMISRARARALARARVSDLATALANDLLHANNLLHANAASLSLAHDLVRDLARARSLARQLAGGLGQISSLGARPRDLDLDLALDLAFDLADTLERALARACELARIHSEGSVDVSGADLSGAAIGDEDLEALDGVVWTQRTTWPPPIAGLVRAHSQPVGPGVYQVRTGDVNADDVRV